MKKRRLAREKALQALYQRDLAEPDQGEFNLDAKLESQKLNEESREYARVLFGGVVENLEEIDKVISESAKNWSVDRVSIVDRSVLRVATFELLFQKDTPFKVVINEAVELAKRFGSEESGSFVNGILDRVARQL